MGASGTHGPFHIHEGRANRDPVAGSAHPLAGIMAPVVRGELRTAAMHGGIGMGFPRIPSGRRASADRNRLEAGDPLSIDRYQTCPYPA